MAEQRSRFGESDGEGTGRVTNDLRPSDNQATVSSFPFRSIPLLSAQFIAVQFLSVQVSSVTFGSVDFR